jgi:CSLREA domain-containing protein
MHRARHVSLAGILLLILSLAIVPSLPARAATTLTVTATIDELDVNGTCSLREAVLAANTDTAVDACPAGSGADTISLPAGTFTLAIVGRQEEAARTGDLDLTSTVTIVGAGAATIIDAAGLDRAFDVSASADVQIVKLAIRNGSAGDERDPGNRSDRFGGCLQNAGTLTLTAVAISNCGANGTDDQGAMGGGIANSGVLTMRDSSVRSNRLGGSENRRAIGAGIYSNGTLTMERSVVADNVGGQGVYDGAVGGGIATSGIASIVDSIVRSNVVLPGGSSVATSATGGGIFNTGTLTLTRSTISVNTAGAGAAEGARGGGIANFGTLSAINVTITGNTAGSGGGVEGSPPAGNGGGILAAGSSTLLNVTLADNQADVGADFAGEAQIENSILAGYQPSQCSGTLSSAGYLLLQSAAGCDLVGDLTGMLVGVNPLLSSLTDNGGPTPSMAPLLGSPVIDAGNPATPGSSATACPATDQRGVTRPQDGDGDGVARCDIGAVEVAATTVTRDPEHDLVMGSIRPGNTVGRVKNRSTTCSYQVGLAVYGWPDGQFADQALFDSQVKTIRPNSTIYLFVDVPSCRYQDDLFYGDLITSFTGGQRYGTRLLAVRHASGPYCTGS